MADPNGYTAKYEKRAGNTQTYGASGEFSCNVDIEDYVDPAAHPADRTITTADDLSAIHAKLNGVGQYYDIENGDYTSLGKIIITASGTSGARKVLRYKRTGDDNDQPWNQTSGNQAKIHMLEFAGANYWIIHRLTFPTPTSAVSGAHRIDMCATTGASTDIILNRLYIKGSGTSTTVGYSAVRVDNEYSGARITLQNSVIHDFPGLVSATSSPVGIDFKLGSNHHIVKNEIYDWREHLIQTGGNGTPKVTLPGLVVENNDLYAAASIVSDTSSTMGWLYSIKSSGTSSQPIQVIQNRFWGGRKQSGGSPDSGALLGDQTNSNYVVMKNNILMDSYAGIHVIDGAGSGNPSFYISIIGNLLYAIGAPYTDGSGVYGRAISLGSTDANNTEIYLNTTIGCTSNTSQHTWGAWNVSNGDFRGNVFISCTELDSTTPVSSTIMDYNVFYDTTVRTFNGTSTNINKTVTTRANSTAYSLNQVIRLTATPPANGTSGDFLYICTTAGTTAGSVPTYPVILGGAVTDGTAVFKAVRGPYKFYKKLRTVSGGEATYIPYAKPWNASTLPEYNFVPSGSEANAIGSRTSIGVDNIKPPVTPYDVDLAGVSR